VRGKFSRIITVLLVASVLLGACAPSATPTPTPRPTVRPPTAVPPTAVPATATPVPVLKITVGTDATWPPFESVDEQTKAFVGFDIDLMKAIAAAAGFEVEFVNVGWDALLAGMATGQYDAAISAMTITEERLNAFDFSAPYFAAGQLIAVRVENSTITGPADLAGKTVGAQLGTTGAIEIEENYTQATLKPYDDISQAFLDLVNRQVDAVVADDPLVEAFIKKYASDLKIVGQALTSEEYGIAVKKGAPEILAAINKGLEMVKAQGVIEQLTAKWIEVEAPTASFRVGYVTDTGGIDDKSFNTNQWEGIQRAVAELGVEAQFIQSDEATQYEPNLTEFASQGYDLIFASGFLLGGDLAKTAAQYPDVKFTIVDYSYPDAFGVPEGIIGHSECIPNVMGQVYKTDQAAFLAGYLAAGMTKTGKIGYFGGMKIPTVTIFGVGFQTGMELYNKVHGTNVQLIGWDNKTGEGLFTGDFADLTKGKEATESLFDEGADIFIPVGGLIGSPGFDVARERGGYGIWVDVDGYNLLPEARDVLLTSVMKKMDNSCYQVIKDTMEGKFNACGVYIGDMVNGGVGIAPYHDLDGKIPVSLKAEIEDLQKKIISGEIKDTGCLTYPNLCPGGLY